MESNVLLRGLVFGVLTFNPEQIKKMKIITAIIFTSYLSTLTFEQLKLLFKDIFESVDPFFLLLRAASLQDIVLIPGINLPNGSRSHGETTGVVPLLLGHGEAVNLEGVFVSEHSVRVLLLRDDEPLVEEEDVSACGRPARSLVDGELVLQGGERSTTCSVALQIGRSLITN